MWCSATVYFRQNTGFYQHLKAVTDSDNQPAIFHEPDYILTKPQPEFISQHLAGGNVITIGKTTGNSQYLVIGKTLLPANNLVNMYQGRISPRLLKGKGGFSITVHSRGAEY